MGSLVGRGVKLFFIGAAFALVLNLLQRQRKVVFFPPGMFSDVLESAWWLLPSCGFAATVIGLLYPCMDSALRRRQEISSAAVAAAVPASKGRRHEWSSVMRCIAVFVGINHASAKISFDSTFQLSLTLGALSLGLWWLFDRSRSGLLLGLVIASLATAVTQVLVFFGVFWYSEPDFVYIRSWVPCIFFSGGVTIGTIGRQLALADEVAAASSSGDSSGGKDHKD